MAISVATDLWRNNDLNVAARKRAKEQTETIEIRPKAQQNAVLVGILCALFCLGGFWMVLSGEEVFGGLVGLAFFGGGALYGIPRMLRRQVPLALTPEGLEQRYPEGNACIPWSDVEAIGLVSMFGTKMVGLRLTSYDRYMGRMSPALAAHLTKTLPYMKLMAGAASLLDTPNAVAAWAKHDGHDVSGGLKSFDEVGSWAEALRWTRDLCGYDIALSWAELDRPAADFVALLEGYRAAMRQS
jgi:Protein of unknown function (DUF2982)